MDRIEKLYTQKNHFDYLGLEYKTIPSNDKKSYEVYQVISGKDVKIKPTKESGFYEALAHGDEI